MLDVSKVLVGSPDQATTGAILDAPVGTPLPKSAVEALDAKFASSGYITSDGVKVSTDRKTSDIADWSGSTVRKLLQSFDGTISWSEMQMSVESLRHAFGASAVKETQANNQHGNQVSLELSASMPEARSWVFKMKDGKARMLIVVPNGQVTDVDSLTFNSSDAIALPVTLSCYPDASGVSIYIYTDDGQVVGA
ncbi:hypothetical protein M1L65_05875 [Slackia exigua]|uniref:phage tail tube protein n=1 Tax=Slackia exigua TaxID=84109 RepID=UPI003BA2BC04